VVFSHTSRPPEARGPGPGWRRARRRFLYQQQCRRPLPTCACAFGALSTAHRAPLSLLPSPPGVATPRRVPLPGPAPTTRWGLRWVHEGTDHIIDGHLLHGRARCGSGLGLAAHTSWKAATKLRRAKTAARRPCLPLPLGSRRKPPINGVGMGLAWGWHGVGMGLAWGRMGLAWGWHGVGMGLAWGLPIRQLGPYRPLLAR
jgi:hypothetical protein